jgi:hypothetical protein
MKKWMLRTLGALFVVGLLLWNVTLAREVAETRQLVEEIQDIEMKLEILAENDLSLQGEILGIWENLVKRWYNVEIE